MYDSEHRQVLHLPIDELVVHPKLIQIYGETENRPSLYESIQREMKILVPLEVSERTGVKVVLAGKCRLQIARELGFTTVPAYVSEYSCEEDELNVLYDLNTHREQKTYYQKLQEASYWEPKFKKEAKQRQQENARQLNKRKRADNSTNNSNLNTSSDQVESTNNSNLNTLLDENKYQQVEKLSTNKQVASKVKLSVGNYHKGKKVYDFISQLKDNGRLRSAEAMQHELNRSVDAAHKFLSNSRREEVLEVIENKKVTSIRDGLGMVGTGSRNPWRLFEVGQVYQFKKEPRPDYYKLARVIKITDEFVVFTFRNQKTHDLETMGLRPSNLIDATLMEEPSALERERVYRLLDRFSHVFTLRSMLNQMLTITHFTAEEHVMLAYLETGIYEQMFESHKLEQEIMAKNALTENLCTV